MSRDILDEADFPRTSSNKSCKNEQHDKTELARISQCSQERRLGMCLAFNRTFGKDDLKVTCLARMLNDEGELVRILV